MGSSGAPADNAAWSPFTVTVPANHAPVLTAANVTKSHLQTLALSSLFSVTDADGDAITQYQLWDFNTRSQQRSFRRQWRGPAGRHGDHIKAANLANTSFVTGSVGDNLQIRAFDGIDWSAADNAAWSPFTVTVPVNHAPVLTTANVTKAHLQTVALSSLFSVRMPTAMP